MKQYLLIDLISDYKEIKSYNELKEMLIQQIVGDTIDNAETRDIVISNVRQLEEMAKENYVSIEYIKEHLSSFSYEVIDLLKMKSDLEELKNFILSKDDYVGNVCEIIDYIDKVVK